MAQVQAPAMVLVQISVMIQAQVRLMAQVLYLTRHPVQHQGVNPVQPPHQNLSPIQVIMQAEGQVMSHLEYEKIEKKLVTALTTNTIIKKNPVPLVE